MLDADADADADGGLDAGADSGADDGSDAGDACDQQSCVWPEYGSAGSSEDGSYWSSSHGPVTCCGHTYRVECGSGHGGQCDCIVDSKPAERVPSPGGIASNRYAMTCNFPMAVADAGG